VSELSADQQSDQRHRFEDPEDKSNAEPELVIDVEPTDTRGHSEVFESKGDCDQDDVPSRRPRPDTSASGQSGSIVRRSGHCSSDRQPDRIDSQHLLREGVSWSGDSRVERRRSTGPRLAAVESDPSLSPASAGQSDRDRGVHRRALGTGRCRTRPAATGGTAHRGAFIALAVYLAVQSTVVLIVGFRPTKSARHRLDRRHGAGDVALGRARPRPVQSSVMPFSRRKGGSPSSTGSGNSSLDGTGVQHTAGMVVGRSSCRLCAALLAIREACASFRD